MVSIAASGPVSSEEYLAFERGAETKHEYHDGVIVARAGGTIPHSVLAMRLGSELTQQLKGRSCLVLNSDMKVWVGANRHFFYPDLSGLCGAPTFHDDARDVLTNPTFIVEVLSPTTEAYDRGNKLARYLALPSLIEIALVSQNEVRVDKYTRQPDGIWRFDVISGMDAKMRFESVGCDVVLREFYDGVELLPTETAKSPRLREDEP